MRQFEAAHIFDAAGGMDFVVKRVHGGQEPGASSGCAPTRSLHQASARSGAQSAAAGILLVFHANHPRISYTPESGLMVGGSRYRVPALICAEPWPTVVHVVGSGPIRGKL